MQTALSTSQSGVLVPSLEKSQGRNASPRLAAPRRSQVAQRAVVNPSRPRYQSQFACASASGEPSFSAHPGAVEFREPSQLPGPASIDEKKRNSWLPRLRLGAGVVLCLILISVTSGAAQAATTDASKGWLAYLVRAPPARHCGTSCLTSPAELFS